MSIFRIYDPETNKYSSGGTRCKFTKAGKAWGGRGRFHNHLNMIVRYDIYSGKFSTWPELFRGDYLTVIDRAEVVEYKDDGSQVHYNLKHYLLSYAIEYIDRQLKSGTYNRENYIKAKSILASELSVTVAIKEDRKSLTQNAVDELEAFFRFRSDNTVQSWVCLKQALNLVPTPVTQLEDKTNGN